MPERHIPLAPATAGTNIGQPTEAAENRHEVAPSARQAVHAAQAAAHHDAVSLSQRRRDPDEIRRAFEKGEYPYTARVSTKAYEAAMLELQVELLKAQHWIKETGERVIMLFEGRDAAGKGGTIKRFTEHLNPRGARVVALEKPSERERSNGISSVTSSICPRPARSCCSTGRGITAPALNGSWAFAPPSSTSNSCVNARSSR